MILVDWALRERCEIWERGNVDGEIEEVNSLYEATGMAGHYRRLVRELSDQKKFLRSFEEGRQADSVSLIYRRLQYFRDEFEDCRSEDEGVTSIREEDAKWMIDEYELILEELIGCSFDADF